VPGARTEIRSAPEQLSCNSFQRFSDTDSIPNGKVSNVREKYDACKAKNSAKKWSFWGFCITREISSSSAITLIQNKGNELLDLRRERGKKAPHSLTLSRRLD
jgi:hypothetical protein